MPRRSSARTLYSDVATLHASSPALAPTALPSSDLLELRRQWKWAAFSQFFFTFAALFNMSDVSIVVSVHLNHTKRHKHDGHHGVASVPMAVERCIDSSLNR